MNSNTALVITTISAPNKALYMLAEGCVQNNIRMIVIGDAKSPTEFSIPGADYYDLKAQRATGLAYADLFPEGHYSRKNIGYLLALQSGAQVIIETDDDNLPREEFWNARQRACTLPSISQPGWVNIYKYFIDSTIWPRGLPLSAVQAESPERSAPALQDCPIQQGLADGDPDVDAIYRLLMPLPIQFRSEQPFSLGRRVWSPFNSQNTTWFRDAFPLMYLPSYCSFRMTDIWRSFVAQRLAWEMDWQVMIHEATMLQERNEHNLMKDFKDEISGYLNNQLIAEALEALNLKQGQESIENNTRSCYQRLIDMDVVGDKEMALLDAWFTDIGNLNG
jgi:hypothetical protein